MEYSKLNDNKVTLEAGLSNALIGKARKRGSLSQENISRILCAYPNLSAEWLMTGRGDMIVNKPPEHELVIYNDSREKDELIQILKKQIALLEEKIARDSMGLGFAPLQEPTVVACEKKEPIELASKDTTPRKRHVKSMN